LSDLSPELVLVLPPEQRELALAALPVRAPDAFLDFRGIPPSTPAAPSRGTAPRPVAALAYAASSAFGMLLIGVTVIAAIVVIVLALQLAG
jgi:hypothetical protein